MSEIKSGVVSPEITIRDEHELANKHSLADGLEIMENIIPFSNTKISDCNLFTEDDATCIETFALFFGIDVNGDHLLYNGERWEMYKTFQYRPFVLKTINVYKRTEKGLNVIYINAGERLSYSNKKHAFYYKKGEEEIYLKSKYLRDNKNINFFNITLESDDKVINLSTFLCDIQSAESFDQMKLRDKYLSLSDMRLNPVELKYRYLKNKISTIFNILNK